MSKLTVVNPDSTKTEPAPELSVVFAVRLRDGRYVARSKASPSATQPRLWVKRHDAERCALRRADGSQVVAFTLQDRSARDARYDVALQVLARLVLDHVPLDKFVTLCASPNQDGEYRELCDAVMGALLRRYEAD